MWGREHGVTGRLSWKDRAQAGGGAAGVAILRRRGAWAAFGVPGGGAAGQGQTRDRVSERGGAGSPGPPTTCTGLGLPPRALVGREQRRRLGRRRGSWGSGWEEGASTESRSGCPGTGRERQDRTRKKGPKTVEGAPLSGAAPWDIPSKRRPRGAPGSGDPMSQGLLWRPKIRGREQPTKVPGR